MKLKEIKQRLDNDDGLYTWIYPMEVENVDYKKTKEQNKLNWNKKIDINIEPGETKDEIICDFLLDYLSLYQSKNFTFIDNIVEINAEMIIKAAIELICNFGSSYSGVHLSMYGEFVNAENVNNCIEIIMRQFDKSDSFIHDIFRDFILEIFSYDDLLGTSDMFYGESIKIENQLFLQRVYKIGYFTKFKVRAAEGS